jgi:hypothetical protein
MISGEITIQAETLEDMVLELTILARRIKGSCRLDEPNGIHKENDAAYAKSLISTFTVLPEYQEGDIEKFFGCDPDFTGELTTEEFIDQIRGRD